MTIEAEFLTQLLSSELPNPETPISEKEPLVRSLGSQCFNRVEGVQYQNSAVKNGCTQVLVNFIKDTTDIDPKIAAFTVLGRIALKNENAGQDVCKCEGYIQLVTETISSKSDPENLQIAAMYSAVNVAGDYWSDHQIFISKIVPIAIDIIKNPLKDINLRSECVDLVLVLTYNSKIRNQLFKISVAPPLAQIILNSQFDTQCAFATVALANLFDTKCASTADRNDSSISVLSKGLRGSVGEFLVNCFRATLLGEEYPQNSGIYFTPWKLALGIKNICHYELNKQALRDAGILVEVTNALLSTSSSSKLKKHCLEILWLLSS